MGKRILITPEEFYKIKQQFLLTSNVSIVAQLFNRSKSVIYVIRNFDTFEKFNVYQITPCYGTWHKKISDFQ